MSKRIELKHIINDNDVPTKKIKKDEINEKKLSNPNTRLEGGTSKELKQSIEKTIISNQIELEGKSNEELNLKKSSVKEISVAGSSKGFDRYNFNFWKKSEVKEGSVQILNPNEIRNEIKINKISSGDFENQSLKIRITYKSQVKETSKGKCVSFLIMDETGEISLASFGKLSLQLFKDMEINCIYCIQNFCAYEENVNYPSGSGNKLQIKANKNFIVQQINDDNSVPKISFNFQSIETIKTQRINSRVDLIGVMTKDYGLEVNNNSNHLRDLHITDQNQGNIVATLWGGAAENFIGSENTVIVIRKAMVSIYQDVKKINCTAGTLVWMNSKISEAEILIRWFEDMKSNRLENN